jgi:hypothetical protein
MFEHHKEPLANRSEFIKRMLRFSTLGAGIMLCSLGIGVFGYHFFEKLPWLDSLLNASMLLGGMGPIAPLATTGGKLFASFYALFAGMVFLVAVGVMVTPVLHRILHHFHLEIEENEEIEETKS